MCIREPCAETWAQSPPLLSPLSFISLHHCLSAASFPFTVFYCFPHPLSSLSPLPVCLSSPLAQTNSLSGALPPSLALALVLSLSISLHQLQRAVSVADLEGTCLLRWNKIIRPLVLLSVSVCVCVCVACTDSEVQ